MRARVRQGKMRRVCAVELWWRLASDADLLVRAILRASASPCGGNVPDPPLDNGGFAAKM
ncbi:MAG: hypothetical protein IID44_03695 [Planctomycetes bacterium]|nr:hypothetical protein [Planctomycetota bacterium]